MSLGTEATPVAAVDSRRVQRRTLVVLSGSQIMGGFGTVTGISVGVLLAATLAGTAVSGLAQSIAVVGQGLLALPVSRVMASRGRRTGLSLGYGVGAAGAALTVLAAAMHSAPLLFAGLFLFGGASTANYQTRYAAVDLAEPTHRARHLALILWAATLGAVIGPNLASATDALARRAGLAPYSGPFLAGGCAFLVAAVVVTLFLRPDPLFIARTTQASQGCEPEASSSGFRVALREIAASPRARLGVGAVIAGHATMISVMAMTPVYIGQLGHSHEATLRILGFTIGLHVIGMFAFSPVVGWLADRAWLGDGRRTVILGGLGLLVAACVVAGTAGHDTTRLAVGLGLLGLGWSATIVAGSTLLSEAVGAGNRPSVQGLADLVMNLAAAAAGALAGLVTDWSGFPTLTALMAIAVLPVVALALRTAAREPSLAR